MKILEDRLFLADTIVNRIREEGYKSDKAQKNWYKELVTFIAMKAEGKYVL